MKRKYQDERNLYDRIAAVMPTVQKAIFKGQDVEAAIDQELANHMKKVKKLERSVKAKNRVRGFVKQFLIPLMEKVSFDPKTEGFNIPFGTEKFYQALDNAVNAYIDGKQDEIQKANARLKEVLGEKVNLQYIAEGLKEAVGREAKEREAVEKDNKALDNRSVELYKLIIKNVTARQNAEGELERITQNATWQHWIGKANECAENKNYAGLKANYERAIAVDPTNIEPYLAFANACKRLNILNRDAVDVLTQALRKCKVSRAQKQEVLEERAYHSKFIGEYKDARADRKRARGFPLIGCVLDLISDAGHKRAYNKERVRVLKPAV